MSIVTLLSDFGTVDGYVAAMKGVVLSLAPRTTLVDISHQIEPFAILSGAFVLSQAWRLFPPGTVHLAVVDPGVGSARRGLAAEKDGHWFVGPDNGLFTLVQPNSCRHLVNPTLWRNPVSETFHGRDVFAPVAAYLAQGDPFEALGPEVDDATRLECIAAQQGPYWQGQVLHVDRYGNVITTFGHRAAEPRAALVNGHRVAGQAGHFAAAPPGGLAWLRGSSGYYEIAINRGSAAAQLHLQPGDPLEVRLLD